MALTENEPAHPQSRHNLSTDSSIHELKRMTGGRNLLSYCLTLLIMSSMIMATAGQPVTVEGQNTLDNEDFQEASNNTENSIGKLLQATSQQAIYIGQFESFQDQSIFNWITEKEGQLNFNIQKFTTLQLQSELESRVAKKTYRFPQLSSGQELLDEKVEGLETKYRVWFDLLNPKYITEQVLEAEFTISPNKIKMGNPEELGNATELCVVLSDNEWACNNTRMNYTKVWRRRVVDEDSENTVLINYRMKLEAKENVDAGYDYTEYRISLVMDTAQGEPIHIRTKAPLVLKNRRVQFTLYCVMLTLLALVQVVSAMKINLKLQNNPMAAEKFSLVVISFCTIADLSATIDYAYRVFDSNSVYYRVFYIFPAVISGLLYFAFDIQILTRVLVTKLNLAQGQPVNLKKFLILFYIGFFVSYEGFVLLKAFFEYQWWLILITSSLILLPQIVKNVRLGFGGDDGFNTWYIMGFLLTRVFLILYKHACPDNYLKIKPFVWLAVLLFTVFSLQVVILVLQSRYSARFFVPKFMRRGYHEYAQKIKVSDLDPEQSFECVVCLQDIRVNPDQPRDESSPQLNRTLVDEITVYRTPCQHMFHEECLKSWMRVKLQCPTCRAQLPMV